MILYSKEKKKGFRGYKYIAKGYVDDKGNYITKDTKEGTDMIEIVCDVISTDNEDVVLKRLENEIKNKVKQFTPIYKT